MKQQAEVGVWFDAIAAELAGDRTKLIELLLHHDSMPPDVREFIAWLLDKKYRQLPLKFWELREWKPHRQKLMTAVMELKKDRADWYAHNQKKRSYPRARLEKIADHHDVDADQLERAHKTHMRLARAVRKVK